MKGLDFFDALKQLDFGQVMIQVSEIEKPYDQKGTVLHWVKDYNGRLVEYYSSKPVYVCKPLDGTVTRWIIKNESELLKERG